jgi:cell division septation protein DedD
MAVTFGTRSAMRDLAEELGPGEQVLELAACTYAGAAGLVALTSQRVIAIRDDYSKHQVQFVVVAEVVTVDYDPTVHDGFALFTSTGRLVVRKMRRQDGDRLVDALLTHAPHIAVHVTRPASAPVAHPDPQLGGQLGRLGRHRKPASPGASPGTSPLGAAAAAQAGAAHGVVNAAGAAGAAGAAASAAAGGAANGAPQPVPAPAAVPSPATPAPAAAHPSPVRPAPQAAMPAPALPPEPATGSRPATDKEVLLGVLADLHAQGVLTAEEFAAKVRQIVTQG